MSEQQYMVLDPDNLLAMDCSAMSLEEAQRLHEKRGGIDVIVPCFWYSFSNAEGVKSGQYMTEMQAEEANIYPIAGGWHWALDESFLTEKMCYCLEM